MQLLSVNVGQAQWLQMSKKTELTGIYKLPATEPVEVTQLGLKADVICDSENHGGPDQAVYLYGEPDYAWWNQELGQALAPGTFGENLTIAGLESAKIQVGDRFHIGEVILEAAATRFPCGTLAARMGDSQFVKRFRTAERPGVYCRVIQPGFVRAGDPVKLEVYSQPTVTILEAFRVHYTPEAELDETVLRRHLAAPISVRERQQKEGQLAKLLVK